MRCEECELLLEEYFDRELESQAAEFLEFHVEICGSCRNSLQRLVAEYEAYANCKRDIDVPPTMWPSIQSRLAARRREYFAESASPWWVAAIKRLAMPKISVWAMVAVVIFAVGLTIALMRRVNERQPVTEVSKNQIMTEIEPYPRPERNAARELDNAFRTTLEAQSAKVRKSESAKRNKSIGLRQNRGSSVDNPSVSGVRNTVELVREAEQKYRTAIVMLSRDVQRQRTRIDPETWTRFASTLSAIDRTIAGTRSVVRNRPDDPVAVQYMLTAYAKKVEVLREMVNF